MSAATPNGERGACQRVGTGEQQAPACQVQHPREACLLLDGRQSEQVAGGPWGQRVQGTGDDKDTRSWWQHFADRWGCMSPS